eukprot:2772528-Alexandrium_andersonii.AAC.1
MSACHGAYTKPVWSFACTHALPSHHLSRVPVFKYRMTGPSSASGQSRTRPGGAGPAMSKA